MNNRNITSKHFTIHLLKILEYTIHPTPARKTRSSDQLLTAAELWQALVSGRRPRKVSGLRLTLNPLRGSHDLNAQCAKEEVLVREQPFKSLGSFTSSLSHIMSRSQACDAQELSLQCPNTTKVTVSTLNFFIARF